MYFGFQNNNIIYILLIAIVAVMLNVKFTDLTSVSDYSACLTTDIKSFVNVETEKKLDIFPIRFFNQISPNRCLEECQDHGDCLSVNYDRIKFYCELLNQKERPAKPLIETVNYVYMELEHIVDQRNKTCGLVACNHYSKCVFTSPNTYICIETECSENCPALHNGYVSGRTFSPITASYACNSGYTGVGHNQITCNPGGKWSSLGYRCEPPVNGGWGTWTGWSTCSKTCNTGSMYRNRSCNNPSPQYGGSGCGYSSAESTTCNTDSCPGET
ncbi:uncharacterized protein LOC144624024 isoform X2 [Crassostrea virginica]